MDKTSYKSIDHRFCRSIACRKCKSVSRVSVYSSKNKMLPLPGWKLSSVINLLSFSNLQLYVSGQKQEVLRHYLFNIFIFLIPPSFSLSSTSYWHECYALFYDHIGFQSVLFLRLLLFYLLSLIIIYFSMFSFIDYFFLFLCCSFLFLFIFVSEMFIITHGSNFIVIASRSWSHKSVITVILVMASIDCLFAFEIFLFLDITGYFFFLKPGHYGYYKT